MSRCVYQATLDKKLIRWKKVLKLIDWDIQIRYATKSDIDKGSIDLEDDLASLETCSPIEKVARILVNKNYPNFDEYNVVWNVDTIILHELIHVLTYEKVHVLPDSIQNHQGLTKLEEFVCDSMARIIFDIYHKSTNKK